MTTIRLVQSGSLRDSSGSYGEPLSIVSGTVLSVPFTIPNASDFGFDIIGIPSEDGVFPIISVHMQLSMQGTATVPSEVEDWCETNIYDFVFNPGVGTNHAYIPYTGLINYKFVQFILEGQTGSSGSVHFDLTYRE